MEKGGFPYKTNIINIYGSLTIYRICTRTILPIPFYQIGWIVLPSIQHAPTPIYSSPFHNNYVWVLSTFITILYFPIYNKYYNIIYYNFPFFIDGTKVWSTCVHFESQESHSLVYEETKNKGYIEKIDELTASLVQKEEALAIAERHLASLQEAVRLHNEDKQVIQTSSLNTWYSWWMNCTT